MREAHRAVAVRLEQTLLDQRLDGRCAACDLRQVVEGDRPVGVEERAEGARAPRGTPPLDAARELQRALRRCVEAHDLSDARAAARPRQLVAAFRQASPHEGAKG